VVEHRLIEIFQVDVLDPRGVEADQAERIHASIGTVARIETQTDRTLSHESVDLIIEFDVGTGVRVEYHGQTGFLRDVRHR
jgi:hypothetical protein